MGIPGGFGSTLVGGLVAAMLYGITTLQTYVYYMHYSEDAPAIKFLVAAVWILDTLHVSFMCDFLYYYLITNYGVLTSLEYMAWPSSAAVLANLLVVTLVQCFFAHKIYYLCRPQVKWLVTAPIMLLVLAHFGFGIEVVVLLIVNNKSSTVGQMTFYASTPFAATIVLAEVLITVSLCVLLYDNSSGSAFPRTKRLLTTLIIYAVNRCLLTLLVALAEFVTTVKLQAAWATALDFTIGKLYANSLLASLNTRQYLRSQDSGAESGERINVLRFENIRKLPEDVENSKDEERQIDEGEAAVT